MFPVNIIELAKTVKARFDELGLTLALAESCTGGLIGAVLTEIPGSSSFFKGGGIVYSNDAKVSVLSVPKKIIDSFGAVSSECAESMAEGALSLYKSDFALSVTGIAGPDGGTVQKPVGLVWFGVAAKNRRSRTFFEIFGGTRGDVRISTVSAGLKAILDEIN